jgi:hypothetical protein
MRPFFWCKRFNKFTRLPIFVMSKYEISSNATSLYVAEADEGCPEGFEVIKTFLSEAIFEAQIVAEVKSEPKEGQNFYSCKWVEGVSPEICRAINAAPGVRLQFG